MFATKSKPKILHIIKRYENLSGGRITLQNTGLILAVILVGGGLFTFVVPVVPVSYQEAFQVQVPYEEQVAYTEQVPYTVEVPYNETVPYTEQVPYTVQVPYDELVTVTKTKSVFSRENRVLSNGFYVGEYNLASYETISIEWSSTKNLIFLSVMKTSTYNALYAALVLEFGATVIGALLTGGTIGVGVATALPAVLTTTAGIIMTSDDYYKINSNYGSDVKSVPSGSYKILIINVNANNVLNIEISYDYEITELQTKYREETEYRTETKFKTITKYKTEIRYKEETKYRTETKYKWETQYKPVRKTVTLWAYIIGSY